MKNPTGKMKSRFYSARAIWLTFFLLAISGKTLAEEPQERDPREYFFTQTFGDFPEELEAARDAGKKGILFVFEAEGCPYCAFMLKNIFNQRKVQDWYASRFVSFTIDIHGDVELTDFDGITLPSKVFSSQRRVFLTPVMTFIDLEGNEIYRHLGMVKTPEEFLAMGEYIAGGNHFFMEFKAFAKNQGIGKAEEILITPAQETAKHKQDQH